MCDISSCDYLQYNTFRFNLIDFQLNRDFPSQFYTFTVKSPSVTKFQVFKIAKFEFNVTVPYGQNVPSCDSLNENPNIAISVFLIVCLLVFCF